MYCPETVVVRMDGDGMVPLIRDRDYRYVDPDESAVDGSVVLFGHGGDAVVRLLVVRPNGRRVLHALSGDWP